MSRVLLTRSQLGRVTHWVRTHHHHHHQHHRFSSSYSTVPFSNIRRTPHPFLLLLNNGKLPPNIVHLTCKSSVKPGFCNVYLIGVNPFTLLSDRIVRGVIRNLKPEVVFLEWSPENQEMLVTKQQTTILRDIKFKPDFIFRKAYEHAMEYGSKVVLGDRPTEITFARAYNKMPFLEKMKLLSVAFRKETHTFIKDFISSVKGSSLPAILGKLDTMFRIMDLHMVTLLTHKHINICPTYVETLLHERDMYMSSKLLEVAKKSSSVVAVVGNAHLHGIEKHWQKPLKVKDLLTVPPPKSTM